MATIKYKIEHLYKTRRNKNIMIFVYDNKVEWGPFDDWFYLEEYYHDDLKEFRESKLLDYELDTYFEKIHQGIKLIGLGINGIYK